ncbi:hypothetical protein J7643_02120 [bacterium]|nr:hypothetical protein [bacterium]
MDVNNQQELFAHMQMVQAEFERQLSDVQARMMTTVGSLQESLLTMAGELDKATTTITRQRFLLLEILENCSDCRPDAVPQGEGPGARCGRCERIARFLGGDEG